MRDFKPGSRMVATDIIYVSETMSGGEMPLAELQDQVGASFGQSSPCDPFLPSSPFNSNSNNSNSNTCDLTQMTDDCKSTTESFALPTLESTLSSAFTEPKSYDVAYTIYNGTFCTTTQALNDSGKCMPVSAAIGNTTDICSSMSDSSPPNLAPSPLERKPTVEELQWYAQNQMQQQGERLRQQQGSPLYTQPALSQSQTMQQTQQSIGQSMTGLAALNVCDDVSSGEDDVFDLFMNHQFSETTIAPIVESAQSVVFPNVQMTFPNTTQFQPIHCSTSPTQLITNASNSLGYIGDKTTMQNNFSPLSSSNASPLGTLDNASLYNGTTLHNATNSFQGAISKTGMFLDALADPSGSVCMNNLNFANDSVQAQLISSKMQSVLSSTAAAIESSKQRSKSAGSVPSEVQQSRMSGLPGEALAALPDEQLTQMTVRDLNRYLRGLR